MMSQEPHLLNHQHHFNDYPTIAGNSLPLPASGFDTPAGHDLFTMEMPNQNWRAAYASETAPSATPAAVSWPIESPSLHSSHQSQILSLSLYNPPHPPSFHLSSHQFPFRLKSCKYLLPSQELLNEFCSLSSGCGSLKRSGGSDHPSSSLCQQSLYSMEPSELQNRKARLLSMIEEVDRRYKRYCDQMKAVVSAFEEIAGDGAARTYSMLASKAMSRHFRCLRDGINAQIKATRRAMGENNASAVAPGQTRGETPRLKLLDQCLRQHKAFQQAGMMESHPWRPQRGLPERSVSILRAWLFEHFLHPYPSDVDKHILARQTGLSRSQVSNWFINARVRLWKPMVEEMYLEELKEEDRNSQSSNATTMQEGPGNRSHPHATNPNPNPSPSSQPLFDEPKPGTGRLHIDENHSLSSIINSMNSHHRNQNPNPNSSFCFDSYSGHELTLGLQQHERPLLFPREAIIGGGEDEVQFSVDGQNIPYRNLMGAQLLHDLAG